LTFYVINISFKEHVLEDGRNRWPKHVAGYVVCSTINLHICTKTSWWYFSYWIKNFTWSLDGSYWKQCETGKWNLVRKQLISLDVRRSYAEGNFGTRVYVKTQILFHGWSQFWTSTLKLENLTRSTVARNVLILTFW